ncbi:MAG: DoxX family membrane protein [Dehalococcoidia bacterium]
MRPGFTSTTAPSTQFFGIVVDRDRRATLLGLGLAVLRIIFGLILLTNGLSKAFGLMHLHPLPGFLIDYNGAKGIIQSNVQHHPIEPYKRLVLDVMVPHWSLFGPLVTLGELSVGLALVLGLLTPLAALAGFAMIFQIYFSRWGIGDGEFLWDYWNEFIPYLVLALTSAGRFYGLDRALAERIPALRRWPLT